jgi:hypothetical protein
LARCALSEYVVVSGGPSGDPVQKSRELQQTEKIGRREDLHRVAAADGLEMLEIAGYQSVSGASDCDFEKRQICAIGKNDVNGAGGDLFTGEPYEINKNIDVIRRKSKKGAEQHIPVFQQNPVVVEHGNSLGNHGINDSARKAVGIDDA